MRRLVALSALVSTALISACDGPKSHDKGAKDNNPASAPPKRDLPDIEVIQNLVSRDCNCRMAGRDSSIIAKRIAEVTNGLKAQRSATSSAPLSSQYTCYPELGAEACVSGGAKTVAHGELICGAEQITELDKLWNRAMPPGHESTVKADAAVSRRINEMQADARRSLSQSDCE